MTRPYRLLVIQCDDESPLGALEAPLVRAGAELEIWRPHEDAARPAVGAVDAIVALGGRADPAADWLDEPRRCLADAVERGTPVLGLCLGAQLLAQVSGGDVTRGPTEIGWRALRFTQHAREDLLLGWPERPQIVFEWHAASVVPPLDAAILAYSEEAIQAFRVGPCAWGLQFHPEIEMSVAAIWLSKAADEVRAQGGSVEELRLESARRIERTAASARGLGHRFSEVVRQLAEPPLSV